MANKFLQLRLEGLVEEMKLAAKEKPFTYEAYSLLSKGIAKFPDELKRRFFASDCEYQVQFSIDQLVGRTFNHLSFARSDHQVPSDEVKEIFKKAFFGDAKTLMFNGIIDPTVIHIGEIT